MGKGKLNSSLNGILTAALIVIAASAGTFACRNLKSGSKLKHPVPVVRKVGEAGQGRRTSGRDGAGGAGLEERASQSEGKPAKRTASRAVSAPASQSASQPKSRGLVVLDPGHGYNNGKKGLYDPGACLNTGGYFEADIVFEQAQRVKEILEKRGYEVVMTRKCRKTSTPLDSRLPLAERLDAGVLVSLHNNAAKDAKHNGIKTLYEDKKSMELARIINNSVWSWVRANGRKDVVNKGIEKRKLRVLGGSMPSVLIESGFLTNPGDRKFLIDDYFDVEQGIAEGIDNYLKLVKSRKDYLNAIRPKQNK
ncbi:hypothetical protein CMI41_03760 [Candidatus Pacearchaeota archaeon]|nr:hypothetical protein [Candidatus Pacearchaeota archaeon]